VVGRQRNPLVEALMDKVRRTGGVGILSAERDLRGIMQTLRRGEFVAIVGDQDAGRDGIFVDFLGRKASTAVGPVRLARRFRVPILMGFAIPLSGARIRIEALPPFLVPTDGPEEEVVYEYTRRWSDDLERYVRRYPHLWFWMHRRWKTRPEAVHRVEEEGG
jgi:KDO2-lipid IV(A) lauroyltransferase